MKNLCIATFSLVLNGKRTPINGMIEPLLSFFLQRTNHIDLIDGAHPGSSIALTTFETYSGGILQRSSYSWSSVLLSPLLSMQNSGGTRTSFKIRDILGVFELFIRQRTTYDLFIGIESIYTICGIILRYFGRARRVVYYVSDYAPNRYGTLFLKDIYLWLDRFCCYHADFIWDVSPAMLPARKKAGLNSKRCKPVILVPNALFPEQITYLPEKKLKNMSIVFAGTFGLENGTKLLIETMRVVVQKIPDVTLHFYGGNKEQEAFLMKLTKSYHLEQNIVFHGLITNTIELSRQISHFMVGIAPYLALPGSPRWYADATKIRLYMGSGLPVITTHVPPLGSMVAKKGAAIVVKDNKLALSDAILHLLTDKAYYRKMRKNAIDYIKENTWEKTYSDALSQMGIGASGHV
ncbi:MAG: glycosyltransferase [bacterium]|nr:glycosyltransferase [bacterium]